MAGRWLSDEYRQIVQSFLDEVDFDIEVEKPRPQVLDRVLSIVRELPDWKTEYERQVRTMNGFVGLMIPHICDDARVDVIISLAVAGVVDDDSALFISGIRFEGGRLIQIDHPGYYYTSMILNSVDRLEQWYEPFIVSMIWRAYFQWLVLLPYEIEVDGLLSHAPSDEFITYIRHLTVVADGTSGYIFDKSCDPNEFLLLNPVLHSFVIEVNNLLSFYKESIVGQDPYNVFTQRQKLHRQPFGQVIRQSRDACLDIIKRLQAVPVSPEMKSKVHQYIGGYVKGHLTTERYRLKELFPDEN